MENNGAPNKIVRKYFVAVEIVFLMLALAVLGLFYNHTTGSAFLMVITQSLLAAWYVLKTITSDAQLRFKLRIMYIGFAVANLAVLFGLLLWPGHKIILVGALAFLAIGWGSFLWSRQSDKNKHQHHQPAASYMMFLRLTLYTAACLVLLFIQQEVI